MIEKHLTEFFIQSQRRSHPTFDLAGMTRIDLPEDKALTKGLERLEAATGLRREFLGSRKRNLKVLKASWKKGLEAALHFCVSEKFCRSELIPGLKSMDQDSLAKAISLVRGRPVYLFWKSQRIGSST